MQISEIKSRMTTLERLITQTGQRLEAQSAYEGRQKDLSDWREARTQLAMYEDILEREQQRALRLREKSNLGRRFFDRTFDNFDETDNRKAKRACQDYVKDRKYEAVNVKNGLILCGGYGTGKTHLAAAIANELVSNGVAVLFDTYNGHLEKLKAEYSTNEVPRYLETMRTIPMLILDDVGKEKLTEWSQSIMFEVINARYEAMLPIIITTNMNQERLEKYCDGASFSRLIEMCEAVVTGGTDRRRDASKTQIRK